MTNKSKREGFILKALDKVEKIGNGLPHPTTMFIIFTLVLIIISWLAAKADKRLTAIVSFVIKVLVAVS